MAALVSQSKLDVIKPTIHGGEATLLGRNYKAMWSSNEKNNPYNSLALL